MIRLGLIVLISLVLHLLALSLDYDLFPAASSAQSPVGKIGVMVISSSSFHPAPILTQSSNTAQKPLKEKDNLSMSPVATTELQTAESHDTVKPVKEDVAVVEEKVAAVPDDALSRESSVNTAHNEALQERTDPNVEPVFIEIDNVINSTDPDPVTVAISSTTLEASNLHDGELKTNAELEGLQGHTGKEFHFVNETVSAEPCYDLNPEPEYPEKASRRGWEGNVLLAVEVLKNGRVKRVSIYESSGYRILDKAAKLAVKKWKFKPAMENGLPVDSVARVPIHFKNNKKMY